MNMRQLKEVVKTINNRKRICLFAPNLEGGGAERVISILAAYLSESGYQVDLILVEAIGPYLNDIPDSVKIIDFQCKRVISTLPKLIKYLSNQKPDILFTSHMHASTAALWAVKLACVKTRVFIRQPTMLIPSSQKQSWNSKLRRKLFLITSKSAYRIIVTSESMSKEFRSLSSVSSDKIIVIHNPVPIDVIQEKSLEPNGHSWFEKGQPPVILAVGRFTTVKDFKTLIKAFYIVHNQMSARLIILGEGSLRLELESLIKHLGIEEFVQMPGFVSNPYHYMKSSKVFVLSSLWEGFPNSMVESMACGTAIVATNCDGGTSEILEYGKWGELVPIKNEIRMADAIIETLNIKNPPNVTERVKGFSIQQIFKEYEELFNL